MGTVHRKIRDFPAGVRRESASMQSASVETQATEIRGRRAFSCRLPNRLPALRGEHPGRSRHGIQD